jgi:hypothetical protein
MAKTWDEIRGVRYSPLTPRQNGRQTFGLYQWRALALLGIDPATNKLYWDSKEIVVRDRLRLGGWANFLANSSPSAHSGRLSWSFGNALNWWPE